MSIQSCPVVYPTWAEFNDFHRYTQFLEKTFSKDYGMVKVVPPTGWKASSKEHEDIDSILIPGAIEQNAFGRGGFYDCAHISNKPMTVGEFRKKTKCFEHITDNLSDKEVEDLFWKNIAFSSPLYAADIQLTLMDQSSGSWNMNNLDSVLNEGMKFPLPGVNTPYCYFGSWKSFFCWHTEDMELAAINFLHSGKTKYWYAIQTNQRTILEDEARIQFPIRFQKCSEHIRHKTTCMNPYKLKAKYPSLKIHKQTQKPGEFILAFSGAYHCGFNSGFNVAEAVNYANYSWLKMLPQAKHCKCRRDSVRISQPNLAEELMESKLKNNPAVIAFFNSTRVMEEQESTKEVGKKTKKKVEQQEYLGEDSLQQDKVNVMDAVKSKRIKKDTKKIVLKGEEFKIDKWAECENCHKWRKVSLKLGKSDHFTCKMGGSTCSKKEEKSKEYITLPKFKA